MLIKYKIKGNVDQKYIDSLKTRTLRIPFGEILDG